jgi:hypothetical protein
LGDAQAWVSAGLPWLVLQLPVSVHERLWALLLQPDHALHCQSGLHACAVFVGGVLAGCTCPPLVADGWLPGQLIPSPPPAVDAFWPAADGADGAAAFWLPVNAQATISSLWFGFRNDVAANPDAASLNSTLYMSEACTPLQFATNAGSLCIALPARYRMLVLAFG